MTHILALQVLDGSAEHDAAPFGADSHVPIPSTPSVMMCGDSTISLLLCPTGF
ncbi:SapB/AmfS family lanthipeptide [Saccharothrix sp. BKS2]|uniref:SapB/AmfS family lanthipeptide n=1 Tax=Saccharothrix sp. BKS2 TaxID=3064400 RepID=UPI0039ECCDD4